MGNNQCERVAWRGAVPISTRFDDPYFSLEDGLAEATHVFLDGNDLPASLCSGFHVAELGVGTGLNLLALARLAEATGVDIRYTGFEAFPLDRASLALALAAFRSLETLANELAAAWQHASFSATIGRVHATVIIGDARETLPAWTGDAQAWFLDGFAPAKNPELWNDDLLRDVGRHTAPGGTFATYTAAGHVRRALTAAGFSVVRRPGYGRKRHMTKGRKEV